jgi:hypothetical protein
MKYSISLRSRGTVMKHLMPLVLVVGVLSLSPWKEGHAQAGGEEGSTESAGMTGTEGRESGTRSREDAGDAGTMGTEGSESGTRSQGDTGSSGVTGSESGAQKPGNKNGTGSEGKSGSGTGTRSGTGSGAGTGGKPRSPE